MQGIDAALRKRGYPPVEVRGQISEVLAAVREAGIMYETALRALDVSSDRREGRGLGG